jgi:hypothetical protein
VNSPPEKCPHGHPIGCKPPCGACVRGEPADKEYVGYANIENSPPVSKCPDCGSSEVVLASGVIVCLHCDDPRERKTNSPPEKCPHGVHRDSPIPCALCEELEHDALIEQLAQHVDLVRAIACCEHANSIALAGAYMNWCRECGAVQSPGGTSWLYPGSSLKAVDIGSHLRGPDGGAHLSDSAPEIVTQAKPRT